MGEGGKQYFVDANDERDKPCCLFTIWVGKQSGIVKKYQLNASTRRKVMAGNKKQKRNRFSILVRKGC
jgi:hypothetical protein